MLHGIGIIITLGDRSDLDDFNRIFNFDFMELASEQLICLNAFSSNITSYQHIA